MNIRSKDQPLVVGGDPRIDLLPPEVRTKRRMRLIRGRLALGVLLLAFVLLGGTLLAREQAIQARNNLGFEQRLTQSLLQQAQVYRDIQNVQAKIALVQAAQQVGISTEINWEKILTALQLTLPPQLTISSINLDSQTPFSIYSPPTAPLQNVRIATLNLTVTSPTLPLVSAWFNSLALLPGFADAAPGSLTRDGTGSYLLNIIIHLNQEAFTNRNGLVGKTP